MLTARSKTRYARAVALSSSNGCNELPQRRSCSTIKRTTTSRSDQLGGMMFVTLVMFSGDIVGRSGSPTKAPMGLEEINVSEATRPGYSRAMRWPMPPPRENPTRCAFVTLSASRRPTASSARSGRVYGEAPGSYVVDRPVSRRSYRTTNRGPSAARRSQNPSSQKSIELAPPARRRIGGSVDLPKVSKQRSTPLMWRICSVKSFLPLSAGSFVGASFEPLKLALFDIVKALLVNRQIVFKAFDILESTKVESWPRLGDRIEI